MKKEKALRNLEFSRQHKKKVSRFTNRKAEANNNANADHEFLASIFATIHFGQDDARDASGGERKRRGRDGK